MFDYRLFLARHRSEIELKTEIIMKKLVLCASFLACSIGMTSAAFAASNPIAIAIHGGAGTIVIVIN